MNTSFHFRQYKLLDLKIHLHIQTNLTCKRYRAVTFWTTNKALTHRVVEIGCVNSTRKGTANLLILLPNGRIKISFAMSAPIKKGLSYMLTKRFFFSLPIQINRLSNINWLGFTLVAVDIIY